MYDEHSTPDTDLLGTRCISESILAMQGRQRFAMEHTVLSFSSNKLHITSITIQFSHMCIPKIKQVRGINHMVDTVQCFLQLFNKGIKLIQST